MKTSAPAQPSITLPSHEDPMVSAAATAIGGPVGEHADIRRRFWTPLRVVLALMCIVLALHWVQKSPCQDGAWEDREQYVKACYTDVLALYYAEGLADGDVPYVDHEVEYPVLTGFLMGVVGLPVNALADAGWFQDLWGWFYDAGMVDTEGPNEPLLFYNITGFLLGLCALITVWALVRSRPSRPWDAAMFALAPAMLVTATVNWDLFAVCLSTTAILAWGRKKIVLAGILFGLATAAKFYPLLMLGPLLVLCLRNKKLPEFATTLGVAAITWGMVNLPVALVAPDSWLKFYAFSQERGVDWGTFWYIGSHWPLGDGKYGFEFFQTLGADIDALNQATTVLLLLGCIGIAALGMFAPVRPRVAALMFLIVALFLLTNKVWSQQFVLWLIPLAVLARPRWWAFLAWQACEVLYFFGFYQILLNADGGKSIVPPVAFEYVSIGRWVSLAVLCGFVVRDILRPERDTVRTSGVEDPEGGVLNEGDYEDDPEPLVRSRKKEMSSA